MKLLHGSRVSETQPGRMDMPDNLETGEACRQKSLNEFCGMVWKVRELTCLLEFIRWFFD